ncbi:hypothetical protein EVAR_97425_1 [Eumeta japonica]|uniref:Uncharacterized protein n=1 Tax=Eumeta variegata TaxID=151549 RepID=A0A4C1X0X4_EUMVA|nr:hypothetical protein EVAR_97425_1 [Eumeta japonica]
MTPPSPSSYRERHSRQDAGQIHKSIKASIWQRVTFFLPNKKSTKKNGLCYRVEGINITNDCITWNNVVSPWTLIYVSSRHPVIGQPTSAASSYKVPRVFTSQSYEEKQKVFSFNLQLCCMEMCSPRTTVASQRLQAAARPPEGPRRVNKRPALIRELLRDCHEISAPVEIAVHLMHSYMFNKSNVDRDCNLERDRDRNLERYQDQSWERDDRSIDGGTRPIFTPARPRAGS